MNCTSGRPTIWYASKRLLFVLIGVEAERVLPKEYDIDTLQAWTDVNIEKRGLNLPRVDELEEFNPDTM
ncbi:hypothetical protein [Bifidobacterium adolescentis]|uniref:hypothetical protein n=1 Tax=Bifidobacterium adolescentis TaxID=1680 RepID=UPI001C38F02C|nr:hypothetical protein [Bifidobacterium adolescentis]MBV3807227.1 hypothetical protein [Bifidobacterium adolescentis]MBV3836117.1 hypothetical protein [Bifidobacterium sp. MSK.17.10]